MEDQNSDPAKGALRDHDKLIAFLFILVCVLGITIVATLLGSDSDTPSTDIVLAAKLRILDVAVGGLLTIGGMAAQGLFRTSTTERLKAQADLETARKTPLLPAPAPAAPSDLGAAVEEGAREGTREGVEQALQTGTEPEVDAAPTRRDATL